MPDSATASLNGTPTETAPDTPLARINWDKVDGEILCPLCGYNLRGLAEPRCPECGSRYVWSDLFDPARRLHPFLYEHHPEMGFRAFWKTVVAGLRPGRFWRGLHPVQPCHGGRLFRYACLTIGVQLLVLGLSHLGWTHARLTLIAMWWTPSPTATSFSAVLAQSLTWLDWRSLFEGSWAPLVLLVWPVLTCVTLFIFTASMLRAKVRAIHVLRATVYSFDLLLWVAVPLLLLAGGRVLFAGEIASQLYTWELLGLADFCVVLTCLLLAAYRLATAYRLYLQFDHPIWTVLASQVICALTVFNGLVLMALR